jgi:DNA polymerase I-like protein with 3'-5' exonuclease and polymerase domains
MDTGEQLRVVCDIETARKLITCIGFTDSINFGMSIPFIRKEGREFVSFWSLEQEKLLLRLMGKVLAHENVLVEGQNFIYDTQYIQYYLGVTPRLDFDTMLAQHLLWPGTPKGLDYISSLYCNYHWYWKDDGKEWDTKGSLEQLLLYNCEDLVRTYEAATVLRDLIARMNLSRQWCETMQRNHLALRMMNRGVKIDKTRRASIGRELAEVLDRIYHELDRIIPECLIPRKKGNQRTPWYRSPKLQQFVFGELLGMRLGTNRKTGSVTMNKEALRELSRKNPLYSGIFLRLEKARSVAVYQSHFIQANLDVDGRIRCSFNPAGTETFRWSSSINPFGVGANLQTIPSGDEE